MTNEQMIRELRAVAEKYKGKHVFTCETNINLMATDAANRIESLCDEISRQKAEIERLEAEIESKQFRCDSCDRIGLTRSEHIVCIKQTKAQAVKEFAEMLKKDISWLWTEMYMNGLKGTPRTHEITYECVEEYIDDLVKEFTEGGNTAQEVLKKITSKEFKSRPHTFEDMLFDNAKDAMEGG